MFKPFNFNYTPPPTVNTPASTTSATQVTAASIVGATSKAGTLISQLNDLVGMARYLQSAILSLTGQVGIEIDPAVDPNTARALCSIYGTNNPPVVISIAMYSNMLSALFGTQQLQSSVGLNSSIQPNPVQVADLMTTTKAVESALIAAPSATNFLPLQLASLQADTIVFQNWANSLSTYPVTFAARPTLGSIPAPIQATSLDMSNSQFTSQSDIIAEFQQAYANSYQALASPSPTQQNANDILQQLIAQPLSVAVSLGSLLTAAQGLISKTGMSTLTGDFVNFSFAQLASDAGSMLTNLDQLTQLGVAPLQGNMGSLSQVVSSVQQQIMSTGTIATGVMAGVSSASSMISNPTVPPSTLNVPGIGQVSDGIKQLGEVLNWGQSSINDTMSIVDKSFQQLLKRKTSSQNDRQSLMNAQGALDTISGLVSGVTSALQAGTLTANTSGSQQQDVANNILTSLQTGSNSTFVAAGNQVIINPPTLPPITPEVQSVLASANIVSITGTVQSS